MRFYSRFVKISRVGQKISKKCHFLGKFFHFCTKKIKGVKAKDFSGWGSRLSTPHPPPTHPTPWNHVCFQLTSNLLICEQARTNAPRSPKQVRPTSTKCSESTDILLSVKLESADTPPLVKQELTDILLSFKQELAELQSRLTDEKRKLAKAQRFRQRRAGQKIEISRRKNQSN